jgi:hypothetical protein
VAIIVATLHADNVSVLPRYVPILKDELTLRGSAYRYQTIPETRRGGIFHGSDPLKPKHGILRQTVFQSLHYVSPEVLAIPFLDDKCIANSFTKRRLFGTLLVRFDEIRRERERFRSHEDEAGLSALYRGLELRLRVRNQRGTDTPVEWTYQNDKDVAFGDACGTVISRRYGPRTEILHSYAVKSIQPGDSTVDFLSTTVKIL